MKRRFPDGAQLQVALVNARFGPEFVELHVPAETSRRSETAKLVRAWRNRWFLVQLYHEGSFERLTINRTAVNVAGDRWVDGITWDELMDCKRAVGYGDRWCVEAYPADAEVVNVANLRHLFVLDGPPVWAWSHGRLGRDPGPGVGDVVG